MTAAQVSKYRHRWYVWRLPEIVTAVVALAMSVAVIMDRIPPQTRLKGWALPIAGAYAYDDDTLLEIIQSYTSERPGGTEIVLDRGENFTPVYLATRRVRNECQGFVMQEIVDSDKNLTPKRTKPVTARYLPHPKDPELGWLIAEPVPVPEMAVPGRGAEFRVTTRRWCPFFLMPSVSLQDWTWPITQEGPTIFFTISDKAPKSAADRR